MPSSQRLSRRLALVAGARVIVTALAGISLVPEGSFGAKAAKADYSYQDQPKDGKSCADCRLFSPSGSGKGACALVDGDISSSGWCLAFSARN